MYSRGYYLYGTQHLQTPTKRQGQAKAATVSTDPMADAGVLLRLGVVVAMALVVVAVVLSFAG